jgi:ribokinase
MAGRIVVIGSNMIDLVTYARRMPERGETLEAERFQSGFGGKGANQAVAAALLGSEVAMIGRVGDDDFATGTLANFVRHGIDATHVARVPGVASGVAPILVEPGGENRILIAPGANAHLLPEDLLPARGLVEGAALAIFQLEIRTATVFAGLEMARKAGVATLLNPAPAPDGPLPDGMLGLVDHLVLNQSELAILSGLAPDAEIDVIDAANGLLARGVGRVVVTLGARGARLVGLEGVAVIAPVPVTALDTTGAGDAFIGAFAHFLVSGSSLETALAAASRYAALSVTRPGTQSSYADRASFARFSAGAAG